MSVVKKIIIGLPWWRSGWESVCQCRGHGFEPWSGKIPHATEQLGPWATTTEPAWPEPVLRNKRGHDSERPAHRDEEWPPLATTRESPRTETKTQHSQKWINNKIIIIIIIKLCKDGNEKLRMRVRSNGIIKEFYHEPKGCPTRGNFKKVTLMSNVKCHRKSKGDQNWDRVKTYG